MYLTYTLLLISVVERVLSKPSLDFLDTNIKVARYTHACHTTSIEPVRLVSFAVDVSGVKPSTDKLSVHYLKVKMEQMKT